MSQDPVFKLGTALARGLRELLEKLEGRLELKSPLQAYLAGGMAVHRANEAIDGYVGGLAMLRANLRDAIAIAREAQGTDVSESEPLASNTPRPKS
jgi:hypothetical protein